MKFTGKHPSRGFAIVLTVTLLSLLVIIALAISLTGRLDADSAGAKRRQSLAKENAMIGLELALSELQKAAGGDAVTASASIRGVTAPAYPYLLGIWASGSANVLPINWFISGNFESAGPNQITYARMPSASSSITLVGPKTVTAQRDMVRAPRVDLGIGGYAFWIGDEGNKASLGFAPDKMPLAPSGLHLQTDPRGEISGFDYSNSDRGNVLVSAQIRLIAPGASLASRFHAYTAQSYWLQNDGSLQAGMFNVNTTESDAWAAVLRSYNLARASRPEIPTEYVTRFAEILVGNFSQKTASGKTRSGPFITSNAFWGSGIVSDSIDELSVEIAIANQQSPTAQQIFLDVTEDDLNAVLAPILVTRSDTFRIRAYGDALNPADENVAGATPEAVAYCEAIVQRTNQPDPNGHGKKFVITYFRWLGPDDI